VRQCSTRSGAFLDEAIRPALCSTRAEGGGASHPWQDGPDVAEPLFHAFASALDCWRPRCCLRRRSRSMDARSTRLICV
jgi:hypothetical protein